MNTKLARKRSELLLMATGVFLFALGLFNRKTRAYLIKILGFGAGIIADYTMQKYLPQPAHIIAEFPLSGSKGGKAVKKRSFKHLKRVKSYLSPQQSRFFTKYSLN